LNKFWTYLNEPIDIASLVFFRIGFGIMMLIEVCRYVNFNWVEKYWIDPVFFFTYEGFHWVQPWDGNGMYLHFFALGILAIFITLGLFYRFSTIAFFVGFSYIFLLDKANYLNHFYLIMLFSFLLCFIPAHRYFSIDSRLNPKIHSSKIARWCLWILVFQLGVVYFYGGIAKINPDWLNGEPMRKWILDSADFPIIGKYFTQSWAAYFFSYSGLLLDLLIVPFLLWKRTRIFAFIAITLFHIINSQIFSIGIFPWLAIAATTIFFEPDWIRKRINKFPSLTKKWHFAAPDNFQITPIKSGFKFFLILYIAVQLLVPFRHFLYPGNVNWTEEGHRFSWHMKLRDKVAKAKFVATDLVTNESYDIPKGKYLSKRQRRKMENRPDMIRQYAMFLAKVYKIKEKKDVAITVNVKASLNNRPYQVLIDPTVDLSKTNYGLERWDWILPLDMGEE